MKYFVVAIVVAVGLSVTATHLLHAGVAGAIAFGAAFGMLSGWIAGAFAIRAKRRA